MKSFLAISLILSVLVGTATAQEAAAQEATPEKKKKPHVLFIPVGELLLALFFCEFLVKDIET